MFCGGAPLIDGVVLLVMTGWVFWFKAVVAKARCALARGRSNSYLVLRGTRRSDMYRVIQETYSGPVLRYLQVVGTMY